MTPDPFAAHRRVPLAARVDLVALGVWNAANQRARDEYRARPNWFGRWPH